MKKTVKIISLILAVFCALSLCACAEVDESYGSLNSDNSSLQSEAKPTVENVERPLIMSDDKIMPNYFDISLFDEENYSEVYLGKRFKFKVTFAGEDLTVPTNLETLSEKGWALADGTQYDENSTLYAGESVDAVFKNSEGLTFKAVFYNSTNRSVKLGKCNIVKIRIENGYYTTPESYGEFNVNGVTNAMAVTDIIDILGVPSHFYGANEKDYFLDYFITKKDRRNGITVYINPSDDILTAIEFSYYK